MADSSHDKNEGHIDRLTARHKAERLMVCNEHITARYVRLERQYWELVSAAVQAPPSAIEPKLNPALLPALPGQKALTVCMFKDDGDAQADAAIEAMKRGDTFLLPQGVSDMFFHQLRLRVALEPSLADKIAVYYLQPDTRDWKEVRFATMEDQFHWPVGFLQDGWEKETQISAVRGGPDSVDAAKKIAGEVRARYGVSDGSTDKV